MCGTGGLPGSLTQTAQDGAVTALCTAASTWERRPRESRRGNTKNSAKDGCATKQVLVRRMRPVCPSPCLHAHRGDRGGLAWTLSVARSTTRDNGTCAERHLRRRSVQWHGARRTCPQQKLCAVRQPPRPLKAQEERYATAGPARGPRIPTWSRLHNIHNGAGGWKTT